MAIASDVLRIRCKPPQRAGYVLIMVLVIISVAAISLAGLARRSLLLATEAVAAEKQLQRYWSANSCRRFFLERAEEIFAAAEKPYSEGEELWPCPSGFSLEVVLAGMPYRLWLSDEDSKLNLNALNAQFREQRTLLTQLFGGQPPLELRPNRSPAANQRKRWFSSWGQVVPIAQLGQPQAWERLLLLSSQLTCFGSEKLNIRRASDQSLTLITSKLLSQEVAQKLLEARSQATDLELKELLQQLTLRRTDQLKLTRWLTDESHCYSLWLELDDGQRKWYHHWILGDSSSGPADSLLSFRW